MKSLVKLLLLSLALPSFSQVQNTFFGSAYLGHSDLQTTYVMMTEYFGKEPGYLCLFDSEVMISQDVVYAGYDWDGIIARFHNGKFAQVTLTYSTDWDRHTSNDILNRYNALKQDLANKYSEKLDCYKLSEKRDDGGLYYTEFYYTDDRYVVLLSLSYKVQNSQKQYYDTYIKYGDIYLLNEPAKPKINNQL